MKHARHRLPVTQDRADQSWLARWADESFCYLTTTGRRTGQAHRIEIWFATHAGRVYLLAGGREHSDWVRNLRANPRVIVQLGNQTRAGSARLLEPDTDEDRLARQLLVAKYTAVEDDLEEWGRTALPVAIDFPAGCAP